MKTLIPLMSFTICVCCVAFAQGLSLPELRQTVDEAKRRVPTAHLTYIEEVVDRNESKGKANSDPAYQAIFKSRSNSRTRIDLLMDGTTKDIKLVRTDLRDVASLMNQYGLPSNQKINFSQTRSLVFSDRHDMEFVDSSLTDDKPLLSLNRSTGSTDAIINMKSLGCVDESILPPDLDPTISEVNVDGRDLFRVEVTFGTPAGEGRRVIDCDPALGYRFRSSRTFINGRLANETIADNYRDIDGVPYPFSYIRRGYAEDGSVLSEQKFSFEKVEFGMKLGPDDFTLEIPENTMLVDLVFNGPIERVKQGGRIGVNQLINQKTLEMVEEALDIIQEIDKGSASASAATSGKMTPAHKGIFIPDLKVLKRNQPFVLDLKTAKLLDSPSRAVRSKSLVQFLIKEGKGDLAWDGNLLLLREAKGVAVTKETKPPTFKYAEEKHLNSFELSKTIKLPFILTVTNREKLTFLVAIEKVEPQKGIIISYKPLGNGKKNEHE